MKENLDEFHWHEALDRASVVGSMFENYVASHPSIQQTPELKKAAYKISIEMGKLYQSIGNHCFKETKS